ncbi:MAG: hypothetical protein ACLFP8_05840 [Alphaproteobacteria bacterium]
MQPRMRTRTYKPTQYAVIVTLGISLLFTTITPAKACSCIRPQTMEAHFNRAKHVLLAEITNTKLVKTVHKEHDLEYIIANIDIIKSFKTNNNEKSAISQVIDLVPEEGNCSIGLISGQEYVFFVDDHQYKGEETEKGTLTLNNYVGRCTGSHMVNIYSINFEDEHKKLKQLAKKHKTRQANKLRLNK